MRRLSIIASFATAAAALGGCQGYKFKQVSAQPVQVVNQQVTVGAKEKPPDIMIVQDLSGSMCEPIQLTAPNNGPSCLATTGSNMGYCSVCSPGGGSCADPTDCASKIQLVATSMSSILSGLKPAPGQLNIGLTTFGGANQTGCNTGSVQVPVADAVTTIPEITQFYASAGPGGGTPTSATLAVAATDPTLTNPDPTARKFILLVTDGLPNCDQTSPCMTEPWSNGQVYGCASTAEVAATLSTGTATPTPPADCVCSFGSCPNVNDTSLCCPLPDTVGPVQAPWYCLDDVGTEGEIAKLYSSQNITTYVVGMGYDYGSNSSVLDAMAAAGHGNPTAFQASTPAALQMALSSLIQQVVATCNYTLDAAPVNAGLITVTLNGVELVAGDPNGYTFTPPTGLTINGSSCVALTNQNGTAENLQITAIAN
jgi:hypothetical protein